MKRSTLYANLLRELRVEKKKVGKLINELNHRCVAGEITREERVKLCYPLHKRMEWLNEQIESAAVVYQRAIDGEQHWKTGRAMKNLQRIATKHGRHKTEFNDPDQMPLGYMRPSEVR